MGFILPAALRGVFVYTWAEARRDHPCGRVRPRAQWCLRRPPVCERGRMGLLLVVARCARITGGEEKKKKNDGRRCDITGGGTGGG